MKQSQTDIVTGGAGFIGSHLCHSLLKSGRRVKVVDSLVTGKLENLADLQESFGDALEFVQADIRDADLEQLLAGCSVVYHQAAMTAVQQSVEDPGSCHAVNSTGTLNVLSAARACGVEKVVLASTTAVYGDSPQIPKKEDQLPDPISPYAASKLSGEHYASIFTHLYGLPVVALRYFNVYGPRQDPKSQYAAVVPIFITRMVAGKPPVIFGDGEQSRDFVFVEDVVAANRKAAGSPASGVTLNVASGASFSLNQLVVFLEEILQTGLEAVYEDDRPGDIRHSSADIELARIEIGFQPSVTFQEGLKRTIEYYLRNLVG